MSERKPYPSDLSDARWALIEPSLTAWRKARLDRRPTGQPAKVDLRDAFNAILYVNRTGIPWKYLPHDFPNHGTVYAYYAAWRDEGIFAQLNYDLTGLARVKEGRKPEPDRIRDRHAEREDFHQRARDQPGNGHREEDIRCEERVKRRGQDGVLPGSGRLRPR